LTKIYRKSFGLLQVYTVKFINTDNGISSLLSKIVMALQHLTTQYLTVSIDLHILTTKLDIMQWKLYSLGFSFNRSLSYQQQQMMTAE